MAGKFPFVPDQSLILQENNPGWNDQSLDYSDATSTVALTDSISDSYVTAVGDNETQYLSVLETTDDVTLEDLHNITLSNAKGEEQKSIIYNENGLENDDRLNVIDLGDQQVVVFTVDGSNDLYGIQVARDEEGNLQKYQFKFRSTEDGQIEAVPESFQLLPNDEDSQQSNNEELLLNEIPTEDFIQNEDGQDENIINFALENQEENNEETIIEQCNQIFIKGERDSPDLTIDNNPTSEEQEEQEQNIKIEHQHNIHYEESENDYQETESSDEYQVQDAEDIKTGILLQNNSDNIGVAPHNIKQEAFQEFSEYSADTFVQTQIEPNLDNENVCGDREISENAFTEIPNEYQETHENYEENEEEINSNDDDGCITYQIEAPAEDLEEFEQIEEPQENEQGDQMMNVTVREFEGNDHYEEVFVEESHIRMLEQREKNQSVKSAERDNVFEENGEENDSDNEEYQIVDGLHITGDLESQQQDSETQTTHSILQEVLEKPIKSSILKNSMMLPKSKKEDGKFYYCVYKYPEKENVNSLSGENIFKPLKINPRSILKSSFIARERLASDEDKLNKRFARNKEAVQAKMFQNFISKTTIQYAPERTTRLPRKQEIKPVDERRDAEIIVQEVLVSPKGFVEDIAGRLRNKEKLRITAIVELSDSEDDGSRNKENRKDDGHFSDSDIIEIRSDDEDPKGESDISKRARGRQKKSPDVSAKDINENQPDILKRRRGRPPKATRSKSTSKSGKDLEESPSKRSRTDSDSETDKKESESDGGKKEIECPRCPKTFPSQNSLKTHIQHHNLENKLKNSQKSNPAVVSKEIKYKHKCDKCEATFKNNILLSRHVCPKKVEFSCGVCLKKFKTQTTLEAHKKVHVKENLVKSTSTAKVSPKRLVTRASSRFPTIRKPAAPGVLKCKDCSKVCSSLTELSIHSKTHQKFSCTNCPATFTSRILLDTHVRISCVKPKSPVNKRLSFKIRKSFVASPRRSTVSKKIDTTLNSSVANTSLNRSAIFNLECETCGQKFTMYRNLYAHKAQKHGMDTPDKSLLEKPKKQLYRPKATHGGIPANEKLKKAYAELRMKLEMDQSMAQ